MSRIDDDSKLDKILENMNYEYELIGLSLHGATWWFITAAYTVPALQWLPDKHTCFSTYSVGSLRLFTVVVHTHSHTIVRGHTHFYNTGYLGQIVHWWPLLFMWHTKGTQSFCCKNNSDNNLCLLKLKVDKLYMPLILCYRVWTSHTCVPFFSTKSRALIDAGS